MDAYLRGLFARMRFLPPPTTDLREAFGMKALAGKTPEGLTSPAAYQIWQAVVAGGQPIVEAGQGWRRAGRSS